MTIITAKSAIRAAFVCGIISTVVTLAAMVIGMMRTGFQYAGIQYSIFTLIDVLLIGGLTAGIYFKSRVCACLMLLYFATNKYIQITSGAGMLAVVMGIVFLFFYARGAYATFVFRRLRQEEANQPVETTETTARPPRLT